MYDKQIQHDQNGVTLLEFILVLPLVLIFITFILDAGVVLSRYSLLVHSTASLTRQLSTDFGRAWHNDSMAGGPCNDWLKTNGNNYLTSIGMNDASMDNGNSTI